LWKYSGRKSERFTFWRMHTTQFFSHRVDQSMLFKSSSLYGQLITEEDVYNCCKLRSSSSWVLSAHRDHQAEPPRTCVTEC